MDLGIQRVGMWPIQSKAYLNLIPTSHSVSTDISSTSWCYWTSNLLVTHRLNMLYVATESNKDFIYGKTQNFPLWTYTRETSVYVATDNLPELYISSSFQLILSLFHSKLSWVKTFWTSDISKNIKTFMLLLAVNWFYLNICRFSMYQ